LYQNKSGLATIWRDGKETLVLALPGIPIGPFGFFSSDGSKVVTSGNGRGQIWNARTGALIKDFQFLERGHLTDISRDGATVLGVDQTHLIVRMNPFTDQMPTLLEGSEEQKQVASAAFSPDEKFLATTGRGSSIRGDTGKLFMAWTGSLYGTFSQSGKYLAPGATRTVELFTYLGREWARQTLFGHTALVTSASFGPGDSLIVSTSEDGTARVWDARGGGHESLVLDAHDTTVVAAAITPRSKQVVTVTADGTIRIFTIDAEALRQMLASRTSVCLTMTFRVDNFNESPGEADRKHEECVARRSERKIDAH
jgi:WD40 repeat protein